MSNIEKQLAPLVRQFWQPALFGYLFITGREGYVSNPSSPLNPNPGGTGPNSINLSGAPTANNGTRYSLTITISNNVSESVNLFMIGTFGTIFIATVSVVNGGPTVTTDLLVPTGNIGTTITVFATDSSQSLSNKLSFTIT